MSEPIDLAEIEPSCGVYTCEVTRDELIALVRAVRAAKAVYEKGMVNHPLIAPGALTITLREATAEWFALRDELAAFTDSAEGK